MSAGTKRNVNEYEGAEVWFSVETVAASPTGYSTELESETRTLPTAGRVRSALMPIAVSVMLSRFTPSRLHRFYSSSTSTPIVQAMPVLDEWVYVPELVTAAQAEALSKLLSLAYQDALAFDYGPDDD